MSDDLEHRGYRGSVEYSREDRVFHGQVLFIDSLLMYHGTTVDEIEQAFEETVDSYLEHCARTGKEPNKPYSGSFNVRVGADRHRALAEVAYRCKSSINEIVCQAVDAFLPNQGRPVVINQQNHHHHYHTTVRHSEAVVETTSYQVPSTSEWSEPSARPLQ